MSQYPVLERIASPQDVKRLSVAELTDLAQDIRHAICDQVSRTGGHLAPNLGVVELTLALHHVFDFSYDRLLFDRRRSPVLPAQADHGPLPAAVEAAQARRHRRVSRAAGEPVRPVQRRPRGHRGLHRHRHGARRPARR
jgi:hypothetical protein